MFILKMTFITWTNLSHQLENLILQPLGPFQMTHVSKGLIFSVETRAHLSYSCLQHLAITSTTFFSDGGTTVSVTHLQGKMENIFTRCNNFLISECIAVYIQHSELYAKSCQYEIRHIILYFVLYGFYKGYKLGIIYWYDFTSSNYFTYSRHVTHTGRINTSSRCVLMSNIFLNNPRDCFRCSSSFSCMSFLVSD